MTISEIISRIRLFNNDTGTTEKFDDTWYTDLIIAAIGDLEPYMGAIAMRDDSFQFTPLRDSEGHIEYEDDGVTPKIDNEIFYNPVEPDSHSPKDIYVNKGLKTATGKTTGHICSQVFSDRYGIAYQEDDIAFVKIDADISIPDSNTDSVNIDVSLDKRETWLKNDYGIIFSVSNGTTGYIDVSRIPSSYIAIEWTVNGAAVIRNTTLWRLYINREQLRHNAVDVIELAKLRILEIRLTKAVENQNDPITINGIKAQIDLIRNKYGLNANKGGNQNPVAGGIAATPYRDNRNVYSVLGFQDSSLVKQNLLANGTVITIKNDGTIRRSC